MGTNLVCLRRHLCSLLVVYKLSILDHRSQEVLSLSSLTSILVHEKCEIQTLEDLPSLAQRTL